MDPATLAAAVIGARAERTVPQALSTAASARVLASPTFARHVDDVLAVVDECRARRSDR